MAHVLEPGRGRRDRRDHPLRRPQHAPALGGGG